MPMHLRLDLYRVGRVQLVVHKYRHCRVPRASRPGTEVTKHEATDSEEEHGVTPTGNREVTTTDSNHEVITNAVKQVMATMYGVKVSKDTATLGPTPTTKVLLDDLPVSALLDTGSPISIVSLEFFLKSAAKKRTSAC